MKVFLFLILSISAGADTITPTRRFSWNQEQYVKKGVRTLPWVRDPFYPTEQKFKLAGIISGELAFINGKWFRKGDRIQGYQVRMVMQDAVSLAKDGEILNLRMGE